MKDNSCFSFLNISPWTDYIKITWKLVAQITDTNSNRHWFRSGWTRESHFNKLSR